MTNRLLALVITLAVTATIAAHAAQARGQSLPSVNVDAHVSIITASLAKHRPVLPTALPSELAATIQASVPGTIQTAAITVTQQARDVIDPKSVVTAAYQRDHDALEQLRQRAAPLSLPARSAFGRVLDRDQEALATLERRALDYQSGDALGSTAQMDELVAQAQGTLTASLGSPNAAHVNTGHQSGGDRSQASHGMGSQAGDSGRAQSHSSGSGDDHSGD